MTASIITELATRHLDPRRPTQSPRCQQIAGDLRSASTGADHRVDARLRALPRRLAAGRRRRLTRIPQRRASGRRSRAGARPERLRPAHGNLHNPRRYSRPLRHVFYLSAQTSMMRAGSQPRLLPQEASPRPHPQPGRHRPRPPPHRRPLGPPARQPNLDRDTATDSLERLDNTIEIPNARPGSGPRAGNGRWWMVSIGCSKPRPAAFGVVVEPAGGRGWCAAASDGAEPTATGRISADPGW